MGSLYYQNPLQIAIGPGLHEIAHIWATPDMFLYEERSGHSGNSNLGGILGGWKPNTLKYLEDGNYQIETVNNSIAPKGWAANFLPYGNFELYLMGLFSQEEVGHDLVQANDFQWIDRLEGTFSASSITTTTMEQFIEQNGPRTPNYLDSQKHFKALFVVVSEEPLTLDEWNLYNNKLAEFETKEDDGFNHRYNFWEATYGRASISFNQGDHLLASSLSGKYELTNTDKNILSYSTASFSVKILGGDRTVADTDNAAGESVSFTATVTDDEKIATTQWLVDGVEVATGLSASVSLPNGSTVVTFRATDNDGQSTTTTATITVEVPNVSPVVTITGGDRTLADSDKVAGESVSFTATATDNDGTIAATQWLVGGVEVAVGLSASVSLPNGSTVVTFKATDDGGKSSTTTATITVKAPAYTPTEEWPSPYNGVTPDSSLELAFNNVGIFNTSDATIYTCLRLFTNGVAVSKNGIGEFDIGLNVVSLSEATVQITKFREFNTIGALNEKVQAPDCSGKFETTTGLYTDIIQVNTSVLETVWSLIDSTKLILKLISSKELTAN
jgi:predicted thioesterase